MSFLVAGHGDYPQVQWDLQKPPDMNKLAKWTLCVELGGGIQEWKKGFEGVKAWFDAGGKEYLSRIHKVRFRRGQCLLRLVNGDLLDIYACTRVRV